VFYAAGSIRGFLTVAAYNQGIVVTSSYAANAIPVAEYCCAAIIMALKQTLFFSRRLGREGRNGWNKLDSSIAGAYGSTVGLVSLGMVGKHVLRLLKSYDVEILVYSQSLTKEQADLEGVESVSLEELFKRSDAISIHTANLPETRRMITGKLINSMKEKSVLINTSRGEVIDEEKMIDILQKRSDLTVILDVTNPEPPVEDSPFYRLPNVFLTPHIAGSLQSECRRMGQYAINECRKWINGEPLSYQIDKKTYERMA
jgi:phosphoglycerate dehydrogenase-like enzyme